VLAAAVLALLFAGGAVRADFTVDFTVANPGLALSNVSSPYAELTVKTNADGTVTFSVTNLGKADRLGELGFNLNGITASDFSLKSQTGAKADWLLTAGGEMDGFGSYTEEFGPSTSSANDRQASFTFTLQSTHSGGKLTAEEFLGPNGGNAGEPPGLFDFALHVFPNDGYTGFAGVAAPEASTIALVVSGLVGVGFAGLRRLRRPQSAL
jgi:hypothetical protein